MSSKPNDLFLMTLEKRGYAGMVTARENELKQSKFGGLLLHLIEKAPENELELLQQYLSAKSKLRDAKDKCKALSKALHQ